MKYLKIFENFDNLLENINDIFIDSNLENIEFFFIDADNELEFYIANIPKQDNYIKIERKDIPNLLRTIDMIELEHNCKFIKSDVLFSLYYNKKEDIEAKKKYVPIEISDNDIVAIFDDGDELSLFMSAVGVIRFTFEKI